MILLISIYNHVYLYIFFFGPIFMVIFRENPFGSPVLMAQAVVEPHEMPPRPPGVDPWGSQHSGRSHVYPTCSHRTNQWHPWRSSAGDTTWRPAACELVSWERWLKLNGIEWVEFFGTKELFKAKLESLEFERGEV